MFDELLATADLEVETVANVFIPPKDGKERQHHEAYAALEKHADKVDAAELGRLINAMIIGREVPFCHGKPERLLAAAKRARVDPEKVKKAVADEEKAAAKVAAEKKKDAATKKGPVKPSKKKKAKKR